MNAELVTHAWTSLYIVADVHGESKRLAAAFTQLTDRPIVLVGDYVNRGPDTRGTLDLLVETSRQRGDDLVCLRGNHEDELLAFLREGDLGAFAKVGGLSTLASYVPEVQGDVWMTFCRSFPAAHRQFLTGLPIYFETPDLLVSHAGLNLSNLESRSSDDLVNGDNAELFDAHRTADLQKTIVCGHFVQRTGAPYMSNRFICIDCGCVTFADRPLLTLTWPERLILAF